MTTRQRRRCAPATHRNLARPSTPAPARTVMASMPRASPRICRRSPAIPIVLDNDPSSLINLVLNGSNPLVVKGTPDAYRMPQFRQQYSDQEIADVVTFIRNGWGNQAPAVTAAEVAKLRKTTDPTSDQVIILKMR